MQPVTAIHPQRRGAAPERARALFRNLATAEPLDVRRAVTIQRPAADIDALLRLPEEFPRFMNLVERAERIDAHRARLRMKLGPVHRDLVLELVRENGSEDLIWRTPAGARPEVELRVQLRPAPAARGTELELRLRVSPALLRPVMEIALRAQLGADLQRLRQLLEVGEIATGDRRPARKEVMS